MATNARHSRKCSICNHPDRQDIEAAYLRWDSPNAIARAFNLPSRSSIYRHVNATGLVNERRRNMQSALETIVEQVDHTRVSGSNIVNAISILLRMNGTFVEPPKIYKTEITYVNHPNPPISNRDTSILEPHVTP